MRLHAVGEMIRLAGTRLTSAVLLGADKTDESLGTIPAPRPRPPVRAGTRNAGQSLPTTRTPSPRSPVLVGADTIGQGLGAMQAPRPPALANPGRLPASPAPAHPANKSRPGRGLGRLGVRGERT
jgi:hypothetical protein